MVKASCDSFNTLSPDLLWLEFKLVNVQLPLVRIVNKSIIPSSPSLLHLIFKLVTDFLLGLTGSVHHTSVLILFFQRKSLWRSNWLICSEHWWARYTSVLFLDLLTFCHWRLSWLNCIHYWLALHTGVLILDFVCIKQTPYSVKP